MSEPAARQEAVKIDGKAVAESVRAKIKQDVTALVAKGVTPGWGCAFSVGCDFFRSRAGFAVVLVGERPDSATYVRMKEQAAVETGIKFIRVALPETVTEPELLARVEELNRTASVHGLIVQLPLPPHINEQRILDAVSLAKDIDGFHPQNIGCVAMRSRTALFAPCTPEGGEGALGGSTRHHSFTQR
jgi:5,10-methylene-tetrahydrofolate dehydrogenase/methenyl tetrahydrofolate cyclohydrolase